MADLLDRLPELAPALRGMVAYRVPRHPAPIDLYLDGNEGAVPPIGEALGLLHAAGPDVLRRYPDARPLEALVAADLGVDAARVIVTAGGDDALDRLCRAVLAGGREMVLPVPTFEMLDRFARLAGGSVRPVPWRPGAPYPTGDVVAAVGAATAIVVVVSPNNPTGGVATLDDLRRASDAAAAVRALVTLDHAYVEFADADLTAAALALPNVVVVRTLSKAWGLAGLRIGYAVGPEPVISWLRAVGSPYAASRPSVAIAAARVATGRADVDAFVARVRVERAALSDLLRSLGAEPFPSQGNFVFARTRHAGWLKDALAGLGISIRDFPGKPGLEGCVRITCPGDPAAFDRLCAAVRAALAPEALLLDLDGVVADVSGSYREAIASAAASYGVAVGPAEIAAAKAEPGSNNDWVTTRRILARHGVDAPLDEVTARFEAAYQGTPDRAGLWARERLLVPRGGLARIASLLPIGIVTGRPRHDAERFLDHAGIRDVVSAMVCMEDALLKPDPAPVRLALARLGVARAWMLGDAPDDVRAARAAGVVPLGAAAPGDGDATAGALTQAGAARVLGAPADVLATIEEVLS
ncbi:MAG: aminotransferase class I/II-fold pyridoxal phosphate-dependent enzyme [Deltaproteobacteria bacterium]|nr:aminotransferase class I/II-fold pyridoxal phosphate-dependent enzyme [Deltaproteobacteria bacterium]